MGQGGAPEKTAGPILVLFVTNDAIRSAVLRSSLVGEKLDPLKDEGLAAFRWEYCSCSRTNNKHLFQNSSLVSSPPATLWIWLVVCCGFNLWFLCPSFPWHGWLVSVGRRLPFWRQHAPTTMWYAQCLAVDVPVSLGWHHLWMGDNMRVAVNFTQPWKHDWKTRLDGFMAEMWICNRSIGLFFCASWFFLSYFLAINFEGLHPSWYVFNNHAIAN